MQYALDASGNRITATPNAKGICICCEAEMIAKCGSIKVHHWSHKSRKHCDPWWENETQWHRDWKNQFPKEWQEVVHIADDGEKHIADIKTPEGLVIEFQHTQVLNLKKWMHEMLSLKTSSGWLMEAD